MTVRNQPRRHEDYTVGLICAIPVEAAAAKGMLDEIHDAPSDLKQDPMDNNTYVLGRVGEHNVVIACLPAGLVGTDTAATVATRMLFTFKWIRFGLMVGVGGGVPSKTKDIRLGDVVVSQPGDASGGVIQYDFGMTVQEGRFKRTRSLNRPPDVLLTALSTLQARYMMEEPQLDNQLQDMFKRWTGMKSKFSHPGVENDTLFRSDYDHPVENKEADSCTDCDPAQILCRAPREQATPKIHSGIIASGNQVMKHGRTRDRLRDELNVLCFEMEAAGLTDNFPCLVIRGICDYCDSHKNKIWQPYAAATAAAFAKEILGVIPAKKVRETSVYPCFMVPFQPVENFVGRRDIMNKVEETLWTTRKLALAGIGGVGKTQIVVEYCYKFRDKHPEADVFWVNASNQTTFSESYREIAIRLDIPGRDDPKFHAVVETKKWLDGHDRDRRWLMVWDNFDDIEMFRSWTEYMPGSLNGSILITSRNLRIDRRLQGHLIRVEALTEMEARSLLEAGRRSNEPSEETAMAELPKMLGCFPLALTQAVAFVKENDTTLVGYKELLADKDGKVPSKLLKSSLWDPQRYDGPHAVFATWKLSFEHIRAKAPKAADLLSFMAMLDPQGIPKTLLLRKDWDKFDLTTALGVLISFSMISQENGGGPFTMHRLVKQATQSFLDQPKELGQYQDEALGQVSKHFPAPPRPENWGICKSLVPHANLVLGYKIEKSMLDQARLLHNLGEYELQHGQYQFADDHLNEAYKLRAQLLGTGEDETLQSSALYASVLISRGQYWEAEERLKEILALREGSRGSPNNNRKATLATENSLARAFAFLGKLR